MKILLVCPQYPDTLYSFRHSLKFIFKRANFPPLGLLTVAAMLPSDWEKKLIDLNTDPLSNNDIKWADYIFISAMAVQQQSTREIIDRCKKFGRKIVAGGPLFTSGYEDFGFDDIDHLVLSEAENTLPSFLEDLENGCARHIYESKIRSDITTTPVPSWSLIDKKKYHSMNIQYSRGCPFDCEFCDITVMNGRKPRTKTTAQILNEIETLYNIGWRSSIFFVDDNFIGNKPRLKSEVLPALIEWMKQKKYPFTFSTEVSMDLADDEELMTLMTDAGFNTVFTGIETPNDESLSECNKTTNKGRDLLASVKTLQNHGFHVRGGFIVGFDSDPHSIFQSQINFIQKSGIVTAMIGILNAPPETRLYKRLVKENRILPGFSGDNTDGETNIIPKMPYELLVQGYRQILDTIYAPKEYYCRIKTFFDEYQPRDKTRSSLKPHQIATLVKSMWALGVKEKGRKYYWDTLVSILFNKPKVLPLFFSLAIQGFHLRKVTQTIQDKKAI
ncbi:MAG: B12-binding domain-containing radical SAM protein [Candidatus Brocadiales bacterium]